jgi:hypothetical protein
MDDDELRGLIHQAWEDTARRSQTRVIGQRRVTCSRRAGRASRLVRCGSLGPAS